MARKKGRRFTVEQKLVIVEEARQPNTTVAEVCRRHGIDGTTFYCLPLGEAGEGGDAGGTLRPVAPQRSGGGTGDRAARTRAGAQASGDRRSGRGEPRAKRGVLKLGEATRFSAAEKAEVLRLVVVTRERTGANPKILTDNGSQFTAKDFKQMVRLFELEHIRIQTYHPESNGVIERFHRSTREELAETNLTNLGRARKLIGR